MTIGFNIYSSSIYDCRYIFSTSVQLGWPGGVMVGCRTYTVINMSLTASQSMAA